MIQYLLKTLFTTNFVATWIVVLGHNDKLAKDGQIDG